jgi:hypothetical protein
MPTVGRLTKTGVNMNNIVIFKQVYGEFNEEKDGRLSGHVMTITGKRKDGKYTVTHAFGSGKRINKIYTTEQLQFEVFKMERKETEQTA